MVGNIVPEVDGTREQETVSISASTEIAKNQRRRYLGFSMGSVVSKQRYRHSPGTMSSESKSLQLSQLLLHKVVHHFTAIKLHTVARLFIGNIGNTCLRN